MLQRGYRAGKWYFARTKQGVVGGCLRNGEVERSSSRSLTRLAALLRGITWECKNARYDAQERESMTAEATTETARHSTQARVSRNALSYGLAQLLSWSVTFLTISIIPRALGKDVLGDLTLAQAPIGLIAGGLMLSLEQYLYVEIGRDRSQTERLLGATFGLRLCLLIPLVVATLVLLVVTKASPFIWQLAVPCILAASLGFFMDPLRAVLVGWEEAKRVSMTDFLCTLTPLCALPVLHYGALPVVYSGLVIPAGVMLVRAYWVGAHVSLRPRFTPTLWTHLIRNGIPFYVSGFIVSFYSIGAIYILKHYADSGAVGIYSQALRLQGTFLFIATALATAMLPALARLAESDEARFQHIQMRVLRLVITLSLPLTAMILLLAEPFCHLLYTKEKFVEMPLALQASALNLIPLYITTLMYQFLLAKRKNVIWCYFLAGTVAANALFCLAFIPLTLRLFHNAAAGAFLAAAGSEFLTVIFAFALLKTNPLNRTTLGQMGRALLATAGMAGVIWVTRNKMILVPATLGTVTFAVLAWFLQALGVEEREQVIKLVQKRLLRRGS